MTVLGGVVFDLHPTANAIDRWGFSTVGRDADKGALVRIVKLGDPLVLVLGTLLASVLAFRRDRLRALACLVGPPLAAVLVELALKPLVGRHFEGVLSYPSGNVTNVAAVATALTLAAPGRWRLVAVVLGAAATVAMAVAVTGLRWHYPTDALGGVVFGTAGCRRCSVPPARSPQRPPAAELTAAVGVSSTMMRSPLPKGVVRP